ncbi:MAG: oligosaccharide flippase family protein [Lachnospiraceae bacterium]|nr:oligosaccharide flippase family protein [Lachnospiraceae bacterium]MBR4604603.1 oligosaccharide flippase family protein [Lachnospiraceae bacterium]
MSREKELVKNSFIISIGTFLPKLVSLVTLPIVSAGLTKAEYGTYDLITTMVSCVMPFITLQIHTAAFRFLVDARNNKLETEKIVSSLLFYIVSVSAVALVAVFFILQKLPVLMRLMICLYFFLDAFVFAMRQVVRGISKNVVYSVSTVVQALIEMALVVVSIKFANMGLIGLLLSFNIAFLASNAVLMIGGKLFSYVKISRISKDEVIRMLKYSWPLVPTVLSDWVLSISDRTVITAFIGIEATAVYGIANKIPALLNLVKTTFTYAWQENASLSSESSDKAEYYTSVFYSIKNIAVGATAMLIAGTPILFRIFIKGDYAEAYPQIPILFLGFFFSLLSAFYGGIYIANKKTVSMGVTTFVAALINLVIDLLFIKLIGIYAASVSTVAGYLFLFVFRTVDLRKKYNMKLDGLKILPYIAVLIGMCVICWQNTLILNGVNLVVGTVFCFIINKDLIFKVTGMLLKKLARIKKK